MLLSPIRSPIRSPLYSPLAKGGGAADELRTWIGAATYADYDARKLDRMFQESTGQTAVAASADKIGLWLDGAQWGGKTFAQLVATQAELMGPSFAGTWTAVAAGVSVLANAVTFAGVATGSTGATVTLANGSPYATTKALLVTVLVTDYVSGGVRVWHGSGYAGPFEANGVYTFVAPYPADTTLRVYAPTTGPTTTLKAVLSVKAVPGFHGLNATASQRLNLLISGGRTTAVGDGSDDNLLTNWLAASGGNTILFDVDVPATIPSGQIIFGSNNVGATYYFVAFNPDGSVGGGVGGQSFGTIKGTADHRGKRVVGAITHDGSTVQLFTLSNGLEYGAAQVGIPNSTIPARIAAYNQGGSAGAYFTGGIARIVPVQKGGLTLADWLKIGPQFAAGTSLA